MKRYHVIGISILAGFIAGVAAPAKADIQDSFILQCANGSKALNYSVLNLGGAHAVTKEFQQFISYKGELFTFAGMITNEGYHYQSANTPDLSLVVKIDSGITTYNILINGKIIDSSECTT
ncbi:hypothetical protein VRM59_004485 [Salmonella enterica]|nr:hypothetical protein [Salmonella enterica]